MNWWNCVPNSVLLIIEPSFCPAPLWTRHPPVRPSQLTNSRLIGPNVLQLRIIGFLVYSIFGSKLGWSKHNFIMMILKSMTDCLTYLPWASSSRFAFATKKIDVDVWGYLTLASSARDMLDLVVLKWWCWCWCCCSWFISLSILHAEYRFLAWKCPFSYCW